MQAITINTAMRNAFENVKVKAAIINTPIVKTVVNVLSTKAGTKPLGRGWTANISKRTFIQLQKDGVFA